MGIDEVKIGDYVRTKHGQIFKVVNINDFREPTMKYGVEADYLDDIVFIGDKEIELYSPNIVEVIKEGDYVNGWRVVEHAHEKGRLFVMPAYVGGIGFTTFENYGWELTRDRAEDINSVVTFEQFCEMEFLP